MDAEILEDVGAVAKPASVPKTKSLSPVRKWLWWIAVLIFLMIMIGGATRLTDSGLSITVWDPIVGAIPPLSEVDWVKAFDMYKTTTEFQQQNSQMTLQEFKFIYWWEWAHRSFGRLIGFVFLLPFLFFLVTGRLNGKLTLKLLILFLLGAAQGALGWYMVKSGLSDRLDVSQYRLAAHLSLASVLFAATIWIALGVGRKREFAWSGNNFMALLILVLLLLQIAGGGFVAGLDAGHASYEWPKMIGAWVPDGLNTLQPLWRNAFENALAVHFNHRILAYVIFALVMIHGWSSFRVSALILGYAVFVQICIGILTVMMHLPLGFALAHQATAMIVLACAVANLHARLVMPEPDQDPLLYRQGLQYQ